MINNYTRVTLPDTIDSSVDRSSDWKIEMSIITLDFINFTDDSGNFESNVIDAIVDGLDITFDSPNNINVSDGEILVSIIVEFTGSRDDLITLVRRYESDIELQSEIIDTIEN